VWLEKTGQLEPAPETQQMQRGNYLEDALLRYAEDTLEKPLIRNQRRVWKDFPVVAANCDALVVNENVPVEAKSTRSTELYGTGEEDVPDDVTCQTTTQMLCTETDIAHVAVIVGTLEMMLYHVRRNERLVALFKSVLKPWWEHCVLEGNEPTEQFYESVGITNINPRALSPSASVAKRIIRDLDKTVELTPDIQAAIQERERLKKQIKDAEAKIDAHDSHIWGALGDAVLGTIGDKAVKVIRVSGKQIPAYYRDAYTYFRVVKNWK